MVKSIQQLKDALQQETDLYKDVLKTAVEKTQVIKAGQLKALEEITKKEQIYIRTMATFEKIRRSIFMTMENELGISGLGTISELLLHLDDQDVEDIDKLRTEVLDIIKSLTEANELNEKLIQQNLDIINFNMEVMTSLAEMNSNYSGSDKGKNKAVTSLLDMKV